MELKEAIYTRRSVRKYLDKSIPHDTLNEIINGALMAPSGVNLQPWYFVVLESPWAVYSYKELMGKKAANFRSTLEQRFPTHPEVVSSTMSFLSSCGGAPVIVLVFMHKKQTGELMQSDPSAQSVAAAIQNLILLAWEKGIASCWMTAPIQAGMTSELEEKYAPENGPFVAAVALGYPAEEPNTPKRKTDRVKFI